VKCWGKSLAMIGRQRMPTSKAGGDLEAEVWNLHYKWVDGSDTRRNERTIDTRVLYPFSLLVPGHVKGRKMNISTIAAMMPIYQSVIHDAV
jgi:allantoicase